MGMAHLTPSLFLRTPISKPTSPAIVLSPPLTEVSPTNQSGVIAILGGFTLAVILLAVLVRLYLRLHTRLQRRDGVAFHLAAVCALAEVATTLYLVSAGLGKDPKLLDDGDEVPGLQKGVKGATMLYLATLCASKVSCALMYEGFTPFCGQKAVAWVIVGASMAWGVASLVVEGVGCRDLLGECSGYRTRWIAISTIDAALETSLVVASIHLVYARSMSLRAKYTVVGVFACRLPNIAITIVRLVFICLSDSATPAIQIARVQGATQLAVGYTVVSCVIPYLRPLMQSFEDDGRGTGNEASFDLSDRSKVFGSADLGESKGKGKAGEPEVSDMGKLLEPGRPGLVRLKSREMVERAIQRIA